MKKSRAWVGIVVMSLAATAHADDEGPAPLASETVSAWDHFELSMGFIAGQRRYGQLSFEGAHRHDPAIFEQAPFTGAPVFGLRYDVRLVVSYVRMTAGIDIPFASYDVDATRITTDGQSATVSGMRGWNLHFGIGGEYPFGAVAPFVDVLGGIGYARATIATDDGNEDELSGRGFGFSVRGGLRLHVRKWFFASVSGEVGLVGDVRWGTELSVGFALM